MTLPIGKKPKVKMSFSSILYGFGIALKSCLNLRIWEKKINSKSLFSFNQAGSKGFTLIEVMVVIALLAIVTGIAMPKFNTGAFNGSSRKVSRWLQLKIPMLKSKAVAEQKAYVLKVDLDSSKLWTEDLSADESANEASAEKAYQFPDSIGIKDVTFADGEQHTSGAVDIVFYPKGYSDQVVIHTEDNNDNTLSFFIEPFLSNIKIVPGYSGFDD